MPENKLLCILAGASLLILGACTDSTIPHLEDAQYWQRANATSAIYINGPKAQQMLQRDIAQCVTDIRELERLGGLRTAIPGDTKANGAVPDPSTPEGRLDNYETPTRDHYLYSEYYNYPDFETCMINKGWERAQYLPYDRAVKSRADYIEAITGEKYQTKIGNQLDESKKPPPPPSDDDFKDLNH